ncbi:MAG TPA: HD domain-containing protein [Cytophagaceae bacterium]|jgi:(p)ppGpp synthase/HD superfamily hydrolase
MTSTIEQIKTFADHCHGEQKRKYSGDRYIVHPIRVMETCRNYTNDITVLAAALLHDVLEDTPVTKEEIKQFLETIIDPENASRTVRIVEELTDVFIKENFPNLKRKKRRAKEALRLGTVSSEAQTIKYADIIDNAVDMSAYDKNFAPLYLSECKDILKNMTRGNAELYQRALQVVEDCLNKFERKQKF